MPNDKIEWLFGREETGAPSAGETAFARPQTEIADQTRHRISNMLAVVRSIARRTAATSRTLEEHAMNFDGRLGAYSRFLSLLPAGAEGLDFGYLLAEELLAAQAHEGDQVAISGPSVQLQPNAAEILGLAFHELVTNAVKHGALGLSGGKVDVSWRLGNDASGEALIFEWLESCVPQLVSIPRRRGFGFELLEETLAFQLDAQTELSFEHAGLRCQIRLPVTPDIFVLPLQLRPSAE